MNIVAVTACPTGIAHTYMAAEQLEKTAKSLGHRIRVETQGAMGIENELSTARHGMELVEKRERFDGKKIVQVTVSQAIRDPKAVLAKAGA